MVINIGALKSGDDALVRKDIRGVVEACKDGRAACKVILETALLTDEEKVRGCELAMKARRRLRQDLDRLRQGRRHRRRRDPDEPHGGAQEARRPWSGRWSSTTR